MATLPFNFIRFRVSAISLQIASLHVTRGQPATIISRPARVIEIVHGPPVPELTFCFTVMVYLSSTVFPILLIIKLKMA